MYIRLSIPISIYTEFEKSAKEYNISPEALMQCVLERFVKKTQNNNINLKKYMPENMNINKKDYFEDINDEI